MQTDSESTSFTDSSIGRVICLVLNKEGSTCAGPEGRQGVRTPLKNHKKIGFLSKTGPDPLKNHKATKPVFNVGASLAHQRNAI